MRTLALWMVAIATAAGQGKNAYQKASQLPARIMEFKAEPASVGAGQPAMLVWSAENPSGTTIDPGIGRVRPRGSMQVMPTQTTTYTLTVRGPNNQVLTKTVTVNVAGAASAATSASAATHPDLTGVYDFSLRGGGGAGGGRGAAPAAPAGPTLKPGAEKFKVVRGPNDAGLTADCMPLVGPQAFSVPYQFQIVQSAHYVAILHEYPGVFRIIPTDGGAHQANLDPTWMGDSIGRWEGDTLVVDSVGFNDKTEISGYKHTESLHLVEKFKRTGDSLQYDVTIEDPNVFAAPWLMNRTFTARHDLTKIDEFVCENNRDYKQFFKQ